MQYAIKQMSYFLTAVFWVYFLYLYLKAIAAQSDFRVTKQQQQKQQQQQQQQQQK